MTSNQFRGRPRLMPGEISRRELEVLRHRAYGENNEQIAAALCISARTVQDHIRNMLARLDLPGGNVTGVENAVRWAVEHGYLDPSAGIDDRGFSPDS